jgi:MFS family permease
VFRAATKRLPAAFALRRLLGQLTQVAPQRKSLILGALLLAAFAINVDTTIVNVALPTLVRELHASTTELDWIVDAYNLVFAALVLASGNLSDRLGRKGVLLVGLGAFGTATVAGALGGTPTELIAARAVMVLGAALIFPATLSLLTNVFAERARAIGLWGATTGVTRSSRRPTTAGPRRARSPGSLRRLP